MKEGKQNKHETPKTWEARKGGSHQLCGEQFHNAPEIELPEIIPDNNARIEMIPDNNKRHKSNQRAHNPRDKSYQECKHT